MQKPIIVEKLLRCVFLISQIKFYALQIDEYRNLQWKIKKKWQKRFFLKWDFFR